MKFEILVVLVYMERDVMKLGNLGVSPLVIYCDMLV